jgi:2-phosphoglycolate phosphatase
VSARIETVLFDLDGTLLDTAPDMALALNRLRAENDLPPLPFEDVRPVVSHGSAALVALGFADEGDPDRLDALRLRYLEIYAADLVRDSCLFPGMVALLEDLEAQGRKWGVVTNKPAWLTEPLMEQLGLAQRAACIVSGDSTSERKPHPEPMYHACRLAESEPARCLYVGDAPRDIAAGQAAGMSTLIARFGYIGAQERPEQWGADGMVDTPGEILDWVHARERITA